MVSYSQRIFWEIKKFEFSCFEMSRNGPTKTAVKYGSLGSPQTWDAKPSVMVAKSRLHAPKINSLPLKNDGWKSTFLLGFGMVLFQGLTVKRGGCKDVSCHRGDWHPHLGHPEESFHANPGDM